MPSRSKIRLDAIERIKHALQSLPEHHDQEVTKTQAIRLLIPEIHAIRSKGYSFSVIVELLSEHGVAVTVPSLKTMLSPSRRDSDGKRRRKAKRKVASAAAETENKAPPSGAQTEGPREELPKTGEKPILSPSHAKAVLAVAGSMTSSVAAPGEVHVATPKAPPLRRSMFIPRPDSEEI
jgi:hypothetical protein